MLSHHCNAVTLLHRKHHSISFKKLAQGRFVGVDFTHAGFIKLGENIVNKEGENFNDGSFVRDR